ncbi:MAG: uroporphyrinogen-III synthase [Flavobacteriales bacterium]
MKRSIFISRNLSESSPLLQFLAANNWDVHHQSLIEIEPLKFSITGELDWIFISSSNGARILLQSYTPKEETKIGVVGEATAKAVRKHGLEPAFIGNSGNMELVGTSFAEKLETGRVLFVGAEGGSEKLRNSLPQEQVSFVPIYRTKLKSEQHLPETNVVYLTSPSNAKAYLAVNPLFGKTAVAIGNTTAEFLASNGVKNIEILDTPTEEAVIELLEALEG